MIQACFGGTSMIYDFFPPEPEHDGGPGLVLGLAEDDEGEGGGDPLR